MTMSTRLISKINLWKKEQLRVIQPEKITQKLQHISMYLTS